MSGIRFQPSKFAESEVARSLELTPAAAATFQRGAVVALNAGGEVIIHPATDTPAYGVCLDGVTAGVGRSPSQQTVVALARSGTEFMGQIIDEALPVLVPSEEVALGERYGVTVVNGVFFVDINKAHDVVEITGWSDEINVVFFRFLTVSDINAA
jgi:hypothetical protein